MKQYYSLSAIILVIIIVVTTIGGSGCANIIAPTGGPRDSLPPNLVKVIPSDSSKDFTANKIVFTFDEYVDAQNARENMIVSPLTKTEPVVEAHLKTVTVKIKDTLEPNTTYTIDFGNAIKDINEGNILKNFYYVFSTGKYLDSLSFDGDVIIAQTGKADTTLTVLLHKKLDDSAVVKDRPRYIAKQDSKGHFRFRNLAPGTYALYALSDEGGQHKYTSPKQYFAFADKPITIGTSNAPVTLYAYLEKDTTQKKSTVSTQAPKPSPVLGGKNKQPDMRLRYRYNLDNEQQDILDDFELNFDTPLKKADSSKLQFLDEKFDPTINYTFIRDTSNKKIILKTAWKENTNYKIIIDKDFAEDTSGKKTFRTDTITFKTKRETEYGSLKIRFNNIDYSKKPVLLLMKGDDIKVAYKLTTKEYNAKLFRPGEYDIRILFDDNDNGVWDTGEFFGKHRQPEKVKAIPRKLNIRANWDNDVTIDL